MECGSKCPYCWATLQAWLLTAVTLFCESNSCSPPWTVDSVESVSPWHSRETQLKDTTAFAELSPQLEFNRGGGLYISSSFIVCWRETTFFKCWYLNSEQEYTIPITKWMGSTFLDDFIWKEFSHLKIQSTNPSFGGQNKIFLGDFFPLSPAEPDSAWGGFCAVDTQSTFLGLVVCVMCWYLAKIDLGESLWGHVGSLWGDGGH